MNGINTHIVLCVVLGKSIFVCLWPFKFLLNGLHFFISCFLLIFFLLFKPKTTKFGILQ